MPSPDWDTAREVLSELSWRRVLVRSALLTVVAGGELRAAIRGRGRQARDSGEAHYRRFFRTETRMLRLFKVAALARRPYGPHGELRTRGQVLEQARKIEAASVGQPFFTGDDEDAVLGCVRIGLGLVHHLVSGTPLPAHCSTGLDWQ